MDTVSHPTSKTTTIKNITYMLLSFPLSLCYFILVVTGLSLGAGTIIIWIGLPILFVTAFLIHGIVTLERNLARTLLNVSFPYQVPRSSSSSQSLLRRFARVLRDPVTWTGTLYIILKFPLSIIAFSLALALPLTAFALTGLPLVYLINLFINEIIAASGVTATGSILIPHFIEIHNTFDLIMFARTFLFVPVGLGFWIIARFLLNNLALIQGEIARSLLGSASSYRATEPHESYVQPLQQHILQ